MLRDFSLVIEPGQTVALVGPSGSGKSTLVGLLARFYAPLEGEVLVDDVPVAEWNLARLRDQIGLVQQARQTPRPLPPPHQPRHHHTISTISAVSLYWGRGVSQPFLGGRFGGSGQPFPGPTLQPLSPPVRATAISVREQRGATARPPAIRFCARVAHCLHLAAKPAGGAMMG